MSSLSPVRYYVWGGIVKGVPASKLSSVLKLSIVYRGLWYVYTGNSDFPPPA
jgi:hypothetical protein